MAAKLFPMLSCNDLPRSLELYGEVLGGTETYRFPSEGEPAFIVAWIADPDGNLVMLAR